MGGGHCGHDDSTAAGPAGVSFIVYIVHQRKWGIRRHRSVAQLDTARIVCGQRWAPIQRCRPCSNRHPLSACPGRTRRSHQAWRLAESQDGTPRNRPGSAPCSPGRCADACHSHTGCNVSRRHQTSRHWARHQDHSTCSCAHRTRSRPEDRLHTLCSRVAHAQLGRRHTQRPLRRPSPERR